MGTSIRAKAFFFVFGCALSSAFADATGVVVAWGANDSGQTNVPAELGGVVGIAAGSGHGLALKNNGTLVAWGRSPGTDVPAACTNVGAISAFGYGSLALKKDGTVVGWPSAAPQGLTEVCAVAAGGWASMALKSNGTVTVWGDNSYGQLNVPVGLMNVKAIAAGDGFCLALLSNGTVVAWGNNNLGQTNVPAMLEGISAISAGADHSLALKSNGTVVAWGRVLAGTPQGSVYAVGVAGGVLHSLALKSDGTVVAWGANQGWPTTNVPVGLSNVSAIAAGTYFNMALRRGTIVAVPSTLTAEPASQQVPAGSDVVMSGTASGTPPFVYQWRFNGAPLAGIEDPILALTNVQPSNSGDYQLIVSNVVGSVTSQVATLTVTPAPPRITLQPQDQTLHVGQSAVFSVAAIGSLPLTYQWQFNGTDITGATNALLLVTSASLETIGEYQVVISNVAGSITSSVAILSLIPVPPCILRQPVSQTAQQGTDLTLNVSASAIDSPLYQWTRNGVDLEGATNGSLVLTNLSLADAGTYRVIVTDPFGATESAPAVLTVVEGPRYAIDWPDLLLTNVASGVFQPTHVTHAGDGSGRIFVTDQLGGIRVLVSTGLLATPFLNIFDRIKTGDIYSELGLYCAVFPPCFSTKRYFYVNYTRRSDGATTVSRFFVSTNEDVADPTSEQIVLTIPQPFENHNGGQMAFGPDGFLYIGMGDGGDHGDPNNRAQNPASLLGKILRIDVESTTNGYAVPTSNPFVGNPNYRPEIWALGFRNPWRFSFDRGTGDLYIADVGESLWEEIDFQFASSHGGENYGWRVQEGTHDFNVPAGFNQASLVAPIAEYGHGLGSSVIGGFVSRGPGNSRMQGMYFYGDFGSGRIWGLKHDGTNWQNRELARPGFPISTFGEDESGRLYVCNYFGGIYRIDDTGVIFAPVLNPAGGVLNSETLVRVSCATPGVTIRYTLDGSDPTEADAMLNFGDGVLVTSNLTFKARAYRSDLLPSSVTMGAFTFVVATPTFDPPAGPLTNGASLSISCTTPDAAIRYTIDGTEPNSSSALYTGPLQISGVTVKSKAFRTGYSDSSTRTTFYGLIRHEITSVTTVAGTTNAGFADGFGASARFAGPFGIAVDAAGTLYVADRGNRRIRSITVSNEVRTFAGSGVAGSDDGPADSARFVSPTGICLGSDRSVYVADPGGLRLRRIDQNGMVSTVKQSVDILYLDVDSLGNFFCGTTSLLIYKIGAGGTSVSPFGTQGGEGVAVDSVGMVTAGNSGGKIYRINSAGQTEVFAGGTLGYHDAPRLIARFIRPADMAIDRFGSVYVSDSTRIAKIAPSGVVTTLAGSSVSGYLDGAAADARFSALAGVCVDNSGQVYVCDANIIRKITQYDWDEDGIPDAEEGGVTPYVIGTDDRLVDSDGDGQSNAAEYLAGTDPLNPDSVFAARNISTDEMGCVTFEWNAAPGRTYFVESSDDLQDWVSTLTIDAAQASTLSVTNCIEPDIPRRFYRLRVSKP